MMNKTITTAALVRHLGATAREIAALRLLFGRRDQFPQDDAVMAMRRLRRNRRPVAAPLKEKLRGVSRRVPEASRHG